MKILLVIGTRPEAIKMAPVFHALQRRVAASPDLVVEVCLTAQHREMLDDVTRAFALNPDYDLNIMRPGQDLTDLTCSILRGLQDVYRSSKPDAVILQGDTTTAMAGALAAFYERINVAHLEAGLRTRDRWSPWPEEVNRRLVSCLSSLHFAPTEGARRNLLRDGISDSDILVTGNTVIDALLLARSLIESDRDLRESLSRFFERVNFSRPVILVTAHRRENFGAGILSLANALRRLAARGDVEFVIPVHPNPAVSNAMRRSLGHISNIHLLEPLSYLPLVYLLSRVAFVITDSGGLQEEAPSFGKPVLVIRDTTERPEGIEAGVAKLIGANEEAVVHFASLLLDNDEVYKRMAFAVNPYGDGSAAESVANAVLARWSV